MAAGYAPHRGHHSTGYAMTWLRRWVQLWPLGVPVRCKAYKPEKLMAGLDTINKQYKVLIYTPHTCHVCRAE